MKNTIALIGFMGSGKTTVGSKLIKMYHDFKLIDTDSEIEKRSGRSISEIFATDGEQAFRQMEIDLLKSISENDTNKYVLSTGGGMPINKECGKILVENTFVVYLYADVDILYERLKYDTERPLLQKGDKREIIASLYSARHDIYKSEADMVVDTSNITVENAVMTIMEAFRNLQ